MLSIESWSALAKRNLWKLEPPLDEPHSSRELLDAQDDRAILTAYRQQTSSQISTCKCELT